MSQQNRQVQKTKYDAIVVGSGAGGGIAAGLLAEAGKQVLLIERGRVPRFGACEQHGHALAEAPQQREFTTDAPQSGGAPPVGP